MAKKKTNLSAYKAAEIPSGAGMKIAIVVSEWNPEITEALFDAAYETLLANGCKEKNILRVNVPGSFELPAGAQLVAESKKPDAVICLGCVIQGETRHFDFICDAVANGLVQLSLKYNKPFIFGVLTPNNMEQARARAGGKHGNKGVEAAVTALKMVALSKSLS
ncbi:MAG: 6,7-dimethyl-8-ribityllumazine synthase [Bacteroidetes bacterium]|nr:6,7-dimethyl-8-ribityllumazine synthase [Bacteroidota bacterium]